MRTQVHSTITHTNAHVQQFSSISLVSPKGKELQGKAYLRKKAQEQLGSHVEVTTDKLLAHDMEQEIRERHIRVFKQTIVKA